jgi:hypothetical protein
MPRDTLITLDAQQLDSTHQRVKSGTRSVYGSLYKGHRYLAEIISHCVWLYHRFPLSFR